MLSFKKIYPLLIIISLLEAEGKVHSMSDTEESKTFQFIPKIGVKSNIWEPGLSSQKFIDYEIKKIPLGYGELKFQINESDIASIEYFDNRLSEENKDINEMYGYYMSLHILKLINAIYPNDILKQIDFDYERREFNGVGVLNQTTGFWYGEREGSYGKDYYILNKPDELSFKSEFERLSLYCTIDKNLLEGLGDFYSSIGAFSMSWNKPTFLGEYLINTRIPLVYDANYESRGVLLTLGAKGSLGNSNNTTYDIRGFLDWGTNNKIKVAKDIPFKDDLGMYITGVTGGFNSKNLLFGLDFSASTNAQWTTVSKQYSNVEIDGEFNYGFNLGLAKTFSF